MKRLQKIKVKMKPVLWAVCHTQFEDSLVLVKLLCPLFRYGLMQIFLVWFGMVAGKLLGFCRYNLIQTEKIRKGFC